MVHYGASGGTNKRPPLLCPKCGSHRTEVVGASVDQERIVIRCNACGERSEMVNPARDTRADVQVVELGA